MCSAGEQALTLACSVCGLSGIHKLLVTHSLDNWQHVAHDAFLAPCWIWQSICLWIAFEVTLMSYFLPLWACLMQGSALGLCDHAGCTMTPSLQGLHPCMVLLLLLLVHQL